MKKKILITGANSYIGEAVENRLLEEYGKYDVECLGLIGINLSEIRFNGIDVIIHVAGIAHRKISDKKSEIYYNVNEKLAVRVAEKAKVEGVKQFIIFSSMSVYGLETGVITKDTIPNPKSHYGISKYNADVAIEKMGSEEFKVVILRPPMVYGKNCKGNYQLLRKIALKIPFFPAVQNCRSMVYIENLTEFVAKVIEANSTGLFFPQDSFYICTSDMVKKIAMNNHKRMILIKLLNPLVYIGRKAGISVFKKVFGDLCYEKVDCVGLKTFDEIMREIEC